MSEPTSLGGVPLTRPPAAPDQGPLDQGFYDLVEANFRRAVEHNPVAATYLGIHAWDHLLPDGTRDAVLGEIEAERRHLAAVEAMDPAGLSAYARFERSLELHNARRSLFNADVSRAWERHSTGVDAIGDGLFPLLTRDFAPALERFEAMAGRLEAVPTYLIEQQTRPVGPQVRLWQEIVIQSGQGLPSFFDEIVHGAESLGLPVSLVDRLRRGTAHAAGAVGEHLTWVRASLASADGAWALGRDRYEELVGLRAFDGLDADAILAIGWEQLVVQRAARAAAAREIDPSADVLEVVERVKSDHPADFEEALTEYRTAMARARRHLIEHGLVTVPQGERVEVIATPTFLRNVMPFAAYFQPAPFDQNPIGTYVVTPSPDGDPDAMREHYRASISNTSIHEAYPGHHLQLDVAARHPSLTRLAADAPEFVEGWGMYCEQMMREEGFDDGPAFRLALATDAIWRACRMILDVRMHRGELTVDEATDFLVDHTRFERPHALAEIRRYSSTPTYPLSYLLGKVLILGLREDERRRHGAAFSLRRFHDTLLTNGSLPISFHRRLLTGEDRPAESRAGGGSGGETGATGSGRTSANRAAARI